MIYSMGGYDGVNNFCHGCAPDGSNMMEKWFSRKKDQIVKHT
ncbi:hypothetical protein [Myroides odoratus]